MFKQKVRGVANKLFSQIDIASLVYFRIAFGFIMFIEVIRFFKHAWISRYYIEPTYFFKYFGFSWINPWPGDLMYIHMIVLGILALMIMFGLFYRFATITFFLGFTYVFLLDQTNHLNHFYLVSLISFLLIFLPANKSLSLDAKIRPKIHSNTVPAWTLWILLFQIGIVYFLGGVAKLNTDWLTGMSIVSLVPPEFLNGPIIGMFSPAAVGWLIAIYLLSIVPLLLWKKTRLFAFIVASSFHINNHFMFSIGIFPWFMIAATALFFPPGKFRRNKIHIEKKKPRITKKHYYAMALIGLYVLIQIVVPFRHVMYPGHPNWTEEGHRFSWHMKERDKDAYERYIVEVEGEMYEVNPYDFLSDRQVSKVPNRPDMVLQFAHIIDERLKEEGVDPKVYAEVYISLNGNDIRLMIDPTVDLSEEERNLKHADWILPYDHNFKYKAPDDLPLLLITQ